VSIEKNAWELAAVKFNEEFQRSKVPVDMHEVNNIRQILKEIFDRNYHQKAGQRVDINNQARYLVEYIGDDFRLVDEENIDSIKTDRELVHNGLQKCIHTEMTEMDMIHPVLHTRLREAIKKMLSTGIPRRIPDEKLACVHLKRAIGPLAIA